ncbi:MAG: MgtC/SapB family protein [Bacteroidota bacterium]
MTIINWTEILIRLTLASFFGAIIGLERERKDWAAGLRTHMMVCLGAALTMIVSAYGFAEVLGSPHVVLDPSRIAAQVISGIGFIGAGTILFLKQGVIRGLTTASGLWTVAAIGLATGGGMYFAALLTTLLALIILWILKPLENKFAGKFKQKNMRIAVIGKDNSTNIILKIFQADYLQIADFSIGNNEDEFIVSFRFKSSNELRLAEMISELHSATGVKEINWSE